MLRKNRQEPAPSPARAAVARCVAGQLLDPGACPWHTAHVFCPECDGWFGIPHEEHRPRGAGDIDYFGFREPGTAQSGDDEDEVVAPAAEAAPEPVLHLVTEPAPAPTPEPRLYHPYAVRAWLRWQLEQPGPEPLDAGTVHALVARLGIVDPDDPAED